MTMDIIKSKVKHGMRMIIISALAGANIATLILLWASCMSSHLDPTIHPRVSQAGLLFPIFLGIDLLFIIIWFIVSWKWILLPVIGMILCWNYVRDYCPINFSENPPDTTYKILSFNVAGLVNEPENNFDGWQTLDYIINNKADIVFLQECPSGGAVFQRLAHSMDSLGYHVRAEGGVRIYSKWPFVGKAMHTSVSYHGNGSYASLVNVNGDTIMLINNHLQSNAISQKEKNEYGNAIEQYDKDKMTASGRLLLSRLSKAAARRAEQTDMLCQLIKEHKNYSMIVGGDLNDTPISYTYQEISKLLHNAFVESGNGTGISFNRKGFPVRIDHIFTSKNLKAYGTFVDYGIKSSDHRPIITRVYKSAK